jgi:hypothetical protein
MVRWQIIATFPIKGAMPRRVLFLVTPTPRAPACPMAADLPVKVGHRPRGAYQARNRSGAHKLARFFEGLDAILENLIGNGGDVLVTARLILADADLTQGGSGRVLGRSGRPSTHGIAAGRQFRLRQLLAHAPLGAHAQLRRCVLRLERTPDAALVDPQRLPLAASSSPQALSV